MISAGPMTFLRVDDVLGLARQLHSALLEKLPEGGFHLDIEAADVCVGDFADIDAEGLAVHFAHGFEGGGLGVDESMEPDRDSDDRSEKEKEEGLGVGHCVMAVIGFRRLMSASRVAACSRFRSITERTSGVRFASGFMSVADRRLTERTAYRRTLESKTFAWPSWLSASRIFHAFPDSTEAR